MVYSIHVAWMLTILVGGVFAAVVSGVFAWLAVRMSRRFPGAPTCGRCRYVVTGVPTFTCPECGSDLRQVGITPAHAPISPRTAARWWLILNGFALLGTLAFILLAASLRRAG